MSLGQFARANYGYAVAAFGVVIGVVGYVKIGVGAIAIGVGIVSYSISRGTRIQRYLPIALAVCLMVMAIALPRER